MEPTPVQPKKWVLSAILTVVVIAVVGILTLPVLGLPPRDPLSSGSFDGGGTSTDLDPSRSHLAETRDRSIAVYVPEQAFPHGGRLIVQPRRAELIPDRVSNDIERLLAVDLLVIDASGDVISGVVFEAPPLLCFRLEENHQTLAFSGQAEINIQRFDDANVPWAWVDMPPVPGWEEQQVCAELDHLSLFALASSSSASESAAYGGKDPPADSQPGLPRLYVPMAGP